MHITVLTLYPEMFPGPLGSGLLAKTHANGIWTLDVVDIRSFASDARGTVDDTAFGGGAGMVLMAPVIHAALQTVTETLQSPRLILTSPRGRPFDQALASDWAGIAGDRTQAIDHSTSPRPLVVVCGRFEGIDQRILDHWSLEDVSLGDFILMGGEVAAMAMCEATLRLLPGVVGNEQSLVEESFEDGLLEHPHYTRPRVWEGKDVPFVLLSGHHKDIKAWRQQERIRLTKDRRPDLWRAYQERKKKPGIADPL